MNACHLLQVKVLYDNVKIIKLIIKQFFNLINCHPYWLVRLARLAASCAALASIHELRARSALYLSAVAAAKASSRQRVRIVCHSICSGR